MYSVPPGLFFRNSESTRIHQLCLLFQKSIGGKLYSFFKQIKQTCYRQQNLIDLWGLKLYPDPELSPERSNISDLDPCTKPLQETIMAVLWCPWKTRGSHSSQQQNNMKFWIKKSQFIYIVSQRVSLLIDSMLVSGNGRRCPLPLVRVKDILPKGSLSTQCEYLSIALKFKEGKTKETSRLVFTVSLFFRAHLIERNWNLLKQISGFKL